MRGRIFLINIWPVSLILRIQMGILYLATWIAYINGFLILVKTIVEIAQTAYLHDLEGSLLAGRLIDSVNFLLLGSVFYLISLKLAQKTWNRTAEIPARIQRLLGVNFRQSMMSLFGMMIGLQLIGALAVWEDLHHMQGILTLVVIALLINRFSRFL